MAFSADLQIAEDTATIILDGELDAAAAPLFQQKIEAVAKEEIKRLVLIMFDLEYMASAGLRMLAFSKQKMGKDVDIYVVGAQELVLETIKKTGFHHSVILQDTYEPVS